MTCVQCGSEHTYVSPDGLCTMCQEAAQRKGKATERVNPCYMRDSGTRETFMPDGGAREAQAGKGRFDLLPYTVIQAVTEACVADAVDKVAAETKSGLLLMVWQSFHDHVQFPLTRALMHLLQDYEQVESLARWYEMGGAKYGDRNWEKGLPLWQIESSALRHACKWCFGMTDEPHDIALAWNIAAWLHFVDKESP